MPAGNLNIAGATGLDQSDHELRNDESGNGPNLSGTLDEAARVLENITRSAAGLRIHNEDDFSLRSEEGQDGDLVDEKGQPLQKRRTEAPDTEGDEDGESDDLGLDDLDLSGVEGLEGLFEPEPKKGEKGDKKDKSGQEVIQTQFGPMTPAAWEKVQATLREQGIVKGGNGQGEIDYQRLAAVIREGQAGGGQPTSGPDQAELAKFDAVINDPDATPEQRQLAGLYKLVKQQQAAIEGLTAGEQNQKVVQQQAKTVQAIQQTVAQFVENDEFFTRDWPGIKETFASPMQLALFMQSNMEGGQAPANMQGHIQHFAQQYKTLLAAAHQDGVKKGAAYVVGKVRQGKQLKGTGSGQRAPASKQPRSGVKQKSPTMYTIEGKRSAKAAAMDLGRQILESAGQE